MQKNTNYRHRLVSLPVEYYLCSTILSNNIVQQQITQVKFFSILYMYKYCQLPVDKWEIPAEQMSSRHPNLKEEDQVDQLMSNTVEDFQRRCFLWELLHPARWFVCLSLSLFFSRYWKKNPYTIFCSTRIFNRFIGKFY